MNKLSEHKSYIVIKNNLKKYGEETQLWYYPYQGKAFELFMETRKGYLVLRPESDERWLVRKKHGDEIVGREIN